MVQAWDFEGPSLLPWWLQSTPTLGGLKTNLSFFPHNGGVHGWPAARNWPSHNSTVAWVGKDGSPAGHWVGRTYARWLIRGHVCKLLFPVWTCPYSCHLCGHCWKAGRRVSGMVSLLPRGVQVHRRSFLPWLRADVASSCRNGRVWHWWHQD